MGTRLNITNGDAAANTLKHFCGGEDVLPWRDSMIDGPFPEGLELSAASTLRAAHLAAAHHLNYDQVLRDFRLRDEHLAAAARYDEITLWFEHDLLDQLQILQLLDWFSSIELIDARLEMICIDTFPGVVPFRGLGQLDPAQMATLIDKKLPVTTIQLNLAQDGWAAFRSSDPRDIETFLEQDLRPLPFLHAALRRHLQEFPSISNGLGRTDQQILQLVSEGHIRPIQIFVANMDLETTLFMGDWSTYRHIHDLCHAARPLLSCKPDGEFRYPPDVAISPESFRNQELFLTDKGVRVLAQAEDAFASMDVDHWLGGVHLLSGKPCWRWNAQLGRLEMADA
jgi:hypothetical protein